MFYQRLNYDYFVNNNFVMATTTTTRRTTVDVNYKNNIDYIYLYTCGNTYCAETNLDFYIFYNKNDNIHN